MGPTQARWFSKGYQEALRDIADALEHSGFEAVDEWLRNNRRSQAEPAILHRAVRRLATSQRAESSKA